MTIFSTALLILGLFLWVFGHNLKSFLPKQRQAWGDAGKGVAAAIIFGGIVALVTGYRLSEAVDLATPPNALRHINNVMMLFALYFMSPAPKRGVLLNGVRHPMLIGFKLWALAHLLVNWDFASILLFGGLLAWAVTTMIRINRADPEWTPRPKGRPLMDGVMAVGCIALMGVIGAIHNWLGYWPFG